MRASQFRTPMLLLYTLEEGRWNRGLFSIVPTPTPVIPGWSWAMCRTHTIRLALPQYMNIAVLCDTLLGT